MSKDFHLYMAYAIFGMIVLIIQCDSSCYCLRQSSATKSSEQIVKEATGIDIFNDLHIDLLLSYW